MSRLSEVFVPKDRRFFDLFEAAAENVVEAAALLDRMLHSWPDEASLAAQIVDLEHAGDKLTHDIVRRLNETFVTPLDREDVLELASALDDVLDFTEEVADYLGLYRIEAPMEQAQTLAGLLHQASRQIAAAMPMLRTFGDIRPFTVEVNRLENEGDHVVREAIASLFDAGIDPMVVIRWKDIFERLEDAIDACERVANVLEGIIIKNA